MNERSRKVNDQVADAIRRFTMSQVTPVAALTWVTPACPGLQKLVYFLGVAGGTAA